LDEGSSNVTDGGEKETDTESGHGSQWPSNPSHEGVKTIVEDGGSNYDSKSVEVWLSDEIANLLYDLDLLEIKSLGAPFKVIAVDIELSEFPIPPLPKLKIGMMKKTAQA